MRTLLRLFVLVLLTGTAISGCRKEVSTPDPEMPSVIAPGAFGYAIQVDVAGQVLDEAGNALVGATITAGYGAQSTTTDEHGAFLLQGITGYSGLGYVKVNKSGYFPGSRSFVPVEGVNAVRVTLLAKNVAGTVQGAAGGSVIAEGMVLTFPAGGFTRNGAAYAGAVSVVVNHIDPASASLFEEMPGALLGTVNNTSQMLRSFGMVGVEITDGGGTPVELSSGSAASLSFPVPPALLGDAPSTIKLWYFNEALGHWVNEGEALLQGNAYMAEVSHFSWWNCDVPTDFVPLTGEVTLQGTGIKVAGARVEIITQTMGNADTQTNEQGLFAGPVPMNETMTATISVPCGSGTYAQVHSQPIGPFSAAGSVSIAIPSSAMATVHGTVVDCDNNPVNAGYVMRDGVVYFCSGGNFTFSTCPGNVTVIAVDQQTFAASDAQELSLSGGVYDMGNVQVCGNGAAAGTVTDIDGYTYATLLIGTQQWMVENLRTTRFANGDPIPDVQDNAQWSMLTTAARASHHNYEAVIGKYYNWFAVDDPRNLCPTGWHVPTDAEWKQLELALGMAQNELDGMGWRGEDANVGGKLKSTTLWWQNVGATNASGFSAQPTGYRYGYNGEVGGVGYTGKWWSGSPATLERAFHRYLMDQEIGIARLSNDMKNGYCVRCLRD